MTSLDTHHTPHPQGASAKGIQIHNLDFAFDNHVIFQNLSFSVEPGRFTGILGPSGVGKTTLLKTIAGLHTPNSGARITDQGGASLCGDIAWMAQKDLLLPWLNVMENVCLGARLRNDQNKKITTDRALSLLEAVGLQDKADQRPDTLSGGMRQRVALARTLMEDRPIILMDEPFSAVDPLTRLSLQNLAASMLQGRTVVFVTHDPLEAIRIGHKVYVLNGSPALLQEVPLPQISLPRPADHHDVLSAHAHILHALAPNATGDA